MEWKGPTHSSSWLAMTSAGRVTTEQSAYMPACIHSLHTWQRDRLRAA